MSGEGRSREVEGKEGCRLATSVVASDGSSCCLELLCEIESCGRKQREDERRIAF